MRLAISNIAWDPSEDELVADLLGAYEIDAIDVAPGKYFPDPKRASSSDIRRVKHWWNQKGIELTGMQALLFGTNGLNLFASSEVQNAMLDHLAAVCRIGEGLGATRLVFGSPKNRDRSGLTDDQALEVAVPFFQRLGDIARSSGVVVCLEPNPTCYGANFMTTSSETAQVVRAIDHPAVKMQLDTGALSINGEDIVDVLAIAGDLIGHIHASEPNLIPLGDSDSDHSAIATALKQRFPSGLVSIEMVATKEEPHLDSVRRAVRFAQKMYRDSSGGESL